MPKRKRTTSREKKGKITNDSGAEHDVSSSSLAGETQRADVLNDSVNKSFVKGFVDLSQSDTDDELPRPFLMKENVSSRKFKINDIVWAKYRGLYWPAVVLQVYVYVKKIKVMFVDSPEFENSISLSSANILPYECKQYKYLLQQKSDDTSQLTKLNSAINDVESFIRKRILKGNKTPPCEYFKCPFMYAFIDSENSSIDALNDKSNLMKSTSDKNEELIEDDVILIDLSEEKDSFSIENTCVQKNCQWLIKQIKSPSCKEHLIKIYRKKIPSDRHSKFFSSIASKRNKLKFKAGFGPIQTDAEIKELSDYLTNILKEESLFYTDLSIASYIFDVWAPEAIIWAMTTEFRITRGKAENLFRKGVNIMEKFENAK